MWLKFFHLVIFIKSQTLLSTKLRTKLLQPDWDILSGERKEWLFYKIYNHQWMFWCLTGNWMWILCIMDVLYWEIHSSECTGLRSLTVENSNIFFLQKCEFFNFLEHVECVIFLSLLCLRHAWLFSLYTHSWKECRNLLKANSI